MGTRERVLDVAQRFPGSPEDRAERAGHPRPLRRHSARSAWSTASGERLYRAHPQPGAGAGAARQIVRHARGDPRRRRVQHAAAADAVRHRAAAHLEPLGIPVRVDAARRRPEPAGSLRGRGRQPDAPSMRGRRSRAPRSRATIRSIANGHETATGVYDDQRRDPVRLACGRARRARPRPVLLRAAGRLPRLLARLLGALPARAQRLTWVVLKAPHEQHGRHGDARVARSARAAAHQLPLLRGRQRRERRGSRAGRRRRQASSGGLAEALKTRGLDRDRGAPGRRGRRRGGSPTFVRNNAWGHHASCTCAIGAATRRRRVERLPGPRRRRACASSTRRSSRGSPAISS